MPSRDEHRRVALAAALKAVIAEGVGDQQTYERERRTCIAHSHAARDAADHGDEED